MLVASKKLLNSPLDREISQVRVVLSNTDKQNGHVGRMHQADKSAHHVADGVTLGDDEAVQCSHRAKGRVEVAGLSDGIRANKGLALHEIVRDCQVNSMFMLQEKKRKENIPRRPSKSCQGWQTWRTSPAKT